MSWSLLEGDCREVIEQEIEPESIDAVVCDPPYELGFMGKKWDSTGIAYSVPLWYQVLQVMKPGAHMLVFGGTRTQHRMVSAIEDAGARIRDQIMWIYGEGMPKSHNIAIAIDKEAGAIGHRGKAHQAYATGKAFQGRDLEDPEPTEEHEGITPEARQWKGWGTGLKPAHEPICMAMRPREGDYTYAQNILHYGTGGLNIDGCRVPAPDQEQLTEYRKRYAESDRHQKGSVRFMKSDTIEPNMTEGRWPANVIHDGSDEVLEGFPETKSSKGVTVSSPTALGQGSGWNNHNNRPTKFQNYGDSGSAARYFYSPKARAGERWGWCDQCDQAFPQTEQSRHLHGLSPRDAQSEHLHYHATVKPLDLMRYLVRLITPPGGKVLDPFAGSGSTLVAAIREEKDCIGIELDNISYRIARTRVQKAYEEPAQQSLF